MLTVEFNIEGYPSPAFLELVSAVRPTQATLVPDPPDVLTSNAGWALGRRRDGSREVLARLREAGIRSSLFLETDAKQIERARELGADRIELYTGPYAHAFRDGGRRSNSASASRGGAAGAQNRAGRERGPRSRSEEYPGAT